MRARPEAVTHVPGVDLNTGERFNPWAGLREAAFQGAVLNLAHAYGWRVAHFRTARIQRRGGEVYHATPVAADGAGWPDLVLVRGGALLVRELKADGGVVRPEQAAWLAALAAAGVDAGVWRPRDYEAIRQTLDAEAERP